MYASEDFVRGCANILSFSTSRFLSVGLHKMIQKPKKEVPQGIMPLRSPHILIFLPASKKLRNPWRQKREVKIRETFQLNVTDAENKAP